MHNLSIRLTNIVDCFKITFLLAKYSSSKKIFQIIFLFFFLELITLNAGFVKIMYNASLCIVKGNNEQTA